jgi:hypothetical protein
MKRHEHPARRQYSGKAPIRAHQDRGVTAGPLRLRRERAVHDGIVSEALA